MESEDRFNRRLQKAIRILEMAEEYLTESQRETLKQISRKYDERKNINDPNWGGLHGKSLKEAIEMTEGGKEVWEKYLWIQEGLAQSPEFSELLVYPDGDDD